MIIVSASAATHLANLLPKNNWFRISVVAGGCSGFEKRFEVCEEISIDDECFGQVVVDQISLDLIGDAVLDYETSLAEQKFTLTIPSANTSCGCGKSFNF
jgi:iron-sulfur cluster insertion protein